ncbi:hypothetical protein [Christiangramia fulva]|nr:hypothetical protein [Christiangramia fulva]
MDLLDYVFSYFTKPKKEVREPLPDGECPVCWGYQEYDSKIRTISRDKHIDVKNHKDHYMKVQRFMVKHLDGIRYKGGKIEQNCTSAKNIS